MSALQITMGGGHDRPQGRLIELPEDVPAPRALVKVLDSQPHVFEAWWSHHTWEGNYRGKENWQSACAVAVDVDYYDSEGHHSAPADDVSRRLLESVEALRMPGSIWHQTPRGFRVAFSFAKSVEDRDLWRRAANGAAHLVEAALAAGGHHGYKIDRGALLDLGRFLFSPCTEVKKKHVIEKRHAQVLLLREQPYSPSDLARAVPIPDRKQVKPSRFSVATHPYIEAALKAEERRVLEAQEGERNNALNRAALSLGHYVGEWLSRSRIEDVLSAAALSAGLEEGEVEATLRSGLDAGEREPKHPPEREQPPLRSVPHSREPGSDDGEGDEQKEPPPEKKRSSLLDAYRQLTAAELLEDPPPVEFILKPYIPKGIVSLLSGPGSANKTTLTIYIAVCRALGLRFFDGETPAVGETVIFSTEDRIDDYKRKLAALRLELGSAFDAEKIAARLHFFDLGGIVVRMVSSTFGQFSPTGIASELADVLAEKAPNADLIFMETISRLAGGVETNESLSMLVEAGQVLCRKRESVGLSVSLIGHVSQEVGRNGITDQYSNRGGSAGSDNSRSAMVLQRVNQETLKKFAPNSEVSDEQLQLLRVLVHSKSNAVMGAKPVLLQCGGNIFGPVLRVPFLNRKGQIDLGERAEGCVQRLVTLVTKKHADGAIVTSGYLRGFTGKDSELGFSEKELPRFLGDAVALGELEMVQNHGQGGGKKIVPTVKP